MYDNIIDIRTKSPFVVAEDDNLATDAFKHLMIKLKQTALILPNDLEETNLNNKLSKLTLINILLHMIENNNVKSNDDTLIPKIENFLDELMKMDI